MNKKIIGAGILVVLIASGVYYKAGRKTENKGTRKYTVNKIVETTFETIVEADGIVEAENTRLVYADRSLKVSELFYEEGDYVKKDEVIMTFDPEDKNQVDRSIKRIKIDIKQLERDLKNAIELMNVGGSSKVEVEDIQFDIDKAMLELADLEEEMSKMLDQIISPFDGTIISMIAEENYRVNTEVELFEMADLSNVIVVAEVPEYHIKGVEIGQRVRVQPDAYKKSFTGVVEKISTLSTATTSSSSNTTTTAGETEAYVEVDISMEAVPKELRPGFNVDVDIITNFSKGTFGVPRGAILEDNKESFVYTVDENNAISKVKVKTGMTNSRLIEVIGLEDGTVVVADPDVTLTEGQIIEIDRTKKSQGNNSNKKGSRPQQGGPGA